MCVHQALLLPAAQLLYPSLLAQLHHSLANLFVLSPDGALRHIRNHYVSDEQHVFRLFAQTK
jgi:hypothetical protein